MTLENMDLEQIKEIVRGAITQLKATDPFLLTKDIGERAISHKLAVYLNDSFAGLDVDCEYNGYAKSDNNKKYIVILRDKLDALRRLRDSDNNDELLKRSVFPDIIVHKRGEDQNLLIIEIKKENNNDTEYDREKIKRYTSPDYDNDLNYKLGALIIFPTGKPDIPHVIEWYENGKLQGTEESGLRR
jgi:hypothetical protein